MTLKKGIRKSAPQAFYDMHRLTISQTEVYLHQWYQISDSNKSKIAKTAHIYSESIIKILEEEL